MSISLEICLSETVLICAITAHVLRMHSPGWASISACSLEALSGQRARLYRAKISEEAVVSVPTGPHHIVRTFGQETTWQLFWAARHTAVYHARNVCAHWSLCLQGYINLLSS